MAMLQPKVNHDARDKVMREEAKRGMSSDQLAVKYGMSKRRVVQICKGIYKQKGYVNREVMAEKKKPKPPEPEPQRVSLHSPVKVYHISDLPKQEQERIMKLRDPYRQHKKPVSGFVPRHV